MKRKSKEIDNQIIELYLKGLSKAKISSQLHIAEKYTRVILNENKINRENLQQSRDLEIINYYQTTRDRQKTAKHFNLSPTTISKILKENNIQTRNVKHVFNKKAFENITTEQQAYWLGFIYADGCLMKKDNAYVLEISLSIVDQGHLIKFNNFMQGNPEMVKIITKHDKRTDKTYQQVRWSTQNKEFGESLLKCGIYPRKTYDLNFPHWLDSHLIPHFIRGFFDGDGSISTKETSKSFLNIQLVGTKEMLESCQKYSNLFKNLIKIKSQTDDNLYHFQFKVGQSLKFLQYIYENATIYLDRKYNLWQSFCRSNKKLLEGLEDKFGKDWDVNSEVTKYLNYAKYRNA